MDIGRAGEGPRRAQGSLGAHGRSVVPFPRPSRPPLTCRTRAATETGAARHIGVGRRVSSPGRPAARRARPQTRAHDPVPAAPGNRSGSGGSLARVGSPRRPLRHEVGTSPRKGAVLVWSSHPESAHLRRGGRGGRRAGPSRSRARVACGTSAPRSPGVTEGSASHGAVVERSGAGSCGVCGLSLARQTARNSQTTPATIAGSVLYAKWPWPSRVRTWASGMAAAARRVHSASCASVSEPVSSIVGAVIASN